MRLDDRQRGVHMGPREALLLFGIVMLFATVFMIYFFANLPHDSNRTFLMYYFGAPYAFFLLCFIFAAAYVVRHRRR